jgi:hypothetical protein
MAGDLNRTRYNALLEWRILASSPLLLGLVIIVLVIILLSRSG